MKNTHYFNAIFAIGLFLLTGFHSGDSRADYAESCKKALPDFAKLKYKDESLSAAYINSPIIAEAIETAARALKPSGGNANASNEQLKGITTQLIINYVKARENFNALDLPSAYFRFDLVRVMSYPDIFKQFENLVVVSNPQSRVHIVGATGRIEVTGVEVKYDKSVSNPFSPWEDVNQYKVQLKLQAVNAGVIDTNRTITVLAGYQGTQAGQNTWENACLNPMQFRIYGYK